MNERSLIIKVVPFQPHSLAFGGFEVQMLAAMMSCKIKGLNIDKLDFWTQDNNYDIIHFWGLEIQHIENIKWGKLSNKKIFITCLVGYPSFKNMINGYIATLFGDFNKRKKILSYVDGISVVNNDQKKALIQIYKYPANKIYVIPNIVNDNFFKIHDNDNRYFNNFKNFNDYLICTGNICIRKNQLNLIYACCELKINLLIVGKILPGQESYANLIKNLINNSSNIKWIEGLQTNSDEIVMLYKNAFAFALPSFDEQQPISALEAAACGKPLLLANRKYAKQEFFKNAMLVNPNSIKSIKKGIELLYLFPKKYTVPSEIINNCLSSKVSIEYEHAYRKLFVN